MSTQQSFYATLARGVKAGGVNASLSSTLLALVSEIDVTPYASRTRFNEEIVLNRELVGACAADGRLRAALAVFSMDRDDQQVKGSLVIPRADGSTSFTDFTDNAATGTNRGLEFTVDWLPSESLTLNLAIGRLDAEFDEYINVDGTHYPVAISRRRLLGNIEQTLRGGYQPHYRQVSRPLAETRFICRIGTTCSRHKRIC